MDNVMTYDPDIHKRHSIRLKDYDYSQAGAYFVTICSWQRECLFGEIIDDAMVLNDLGRIVADEWDRTPELRSNVDLDVWTIMPNYFHGIILIHDATVGAATAGDPPGRPYGGQIKCSVGAMPVARPGAIGNNGGLCNGSKADGPLSGSVGAIMAQFKSIATKRINAYRNNAGCPVWQKNYYERVIRNEYELCRAREYIVNNPLKWALDKENKG